MLMLNTPPPELHEAAVYADALLAAELIAGLRGASVYRDAAFDHPPVDLASGA
jgi:hypothetical protein